MNVVSDDRWLSLPFASSISVWTAATNDRLRRHSPLALILYGGLTTTALLALWRLVWTFRRYGLRKAVGAFIFQVLRLLPLTSSYVRNETAKTVAKLEALVISSETANEVKHVELPNTGLPRTELIQRLQRWAQSEQRRWTSGQASGTVYHGDQTLLTVLSDAYAMFALTNPLHPDIFPFVRKMEAEVIAMTVNMFHGDSGCCGCMTSGGTESILMAIKTYRDRAYTERGIVNCEIIAATTAHAAFNKAAHYFGMTLISVPVHPDTFTVDLRAVRAAITSRTVVIVGSAPCFSQGTIDDITALAEIAREYDVGLHVDACLGGFLLPFLPHITPPITVPPFDFAVAGVTSMSADTHKYGYAPKGSSVVMYRSAALRQYQYFVAAEWTGGIYASPSIAGSRPGGIIAATYAAMIHIGRSGYIECAQAIMDSARFIAAGIAAIDGLCVLGAPVMSVISFTADKSSDIGRALNIYAVSEAMSTLGWSLNTLQHPPSLHICITYVHRTHHRRFIEQLKQSVHRAIDEPNAFKSGSAAIYGMAESIPDATIIEDLAKGYIDCMLKV